MLTREKVVSWEFRLFLARNLGTSNNAIALFGQVEPASTATPLTSLGAAKAFSTLENKAPAVGCIYGREKCDVFNPNVPKVTYVEVFCLLPS